MMEDVDGGDSDSNSTTTTSNDNDGIDDSNETETEPVVYNDHGIEGHNHDTDHSSPDIDETVELLSTTMDDSGATTIATGGSAHFVVLEDSAATTIATGGP